MNKITYLLTRLSFLSVHGFRFCTTLLLEPIGLYSYAAIIKTTIQKRHWKLCWYLILCNQLWTKVGHKILRQSLVELESVTFVHISRCPYKAPNLCQSLLSIFAKRGYNLHFSCCWLILKFCFLQISTSSNNVFYILKTSVTHQLHF